MAGHIDPEEKDGGSLSRLNSQHGNSSHAPKEKEGRITPAGRKALPKTKFALPPGPEEKRRGIEGRFPIDTAARARNALARAAQGVEAGTLSSTEAATVRQAVARAFPDIEQRT